jgi:hypothetical protein
MTLVGDGKYHKYKGKSQIFIFSPVHYDSQFPFVDGDELDIEIVPKSGQIIIRKKNKVQQRLVK